MLSKIGEAPFASLNAAIFPLATKALVPIPLKYPSSLLARTSLGSFSTGWNSHQVYPYPIEPARQAPDAKIGTPIAINSPPAPAAENPIAADHNEGRTEAREVSW